MSRFRSLLAPAAREALQREAAEVERLHGLSDRFLGRALIGLSRQARRDAPDLFEDREVSGYEALLVRAVVPRLARDLGEMGLDAEERSLLPLAAGDGACLRQLVGACLDNQRLDRLGGQRGSPALRLLGRSFVNGNPVTIALDRVAPPLPESRDWVARHMREISRARFGHEGHVAWSPEFQLYPRAEAADDTPSP